jgi:amino acid transporter
MALNSTITPNSLTVDCAGFMSNLDAYSVPPTVRRLSGAFRVFGWISFWAQVVLAAIATLVLIFSSLLLGLQGNNQTAQATNNDNLGGGVGFFFAFAGILLLYAGIYWAFRYTRLARHLINPGNESRPKPKDVVQTLRIGLLINLMGMFLTLIGGEALIGGLFGKALSQPQGGALYDRLTQAIQPLDILIVQANTHTILAHFVGLIASLWLVRCLSRQA